MTTTPDWTLLRSFLAVAESGSLSAAASRLGLSQPTLGRHVSELESALGIPLFTRRPKGLALTDAGADLLPHARSMQEAAARLALTAAGRAGAVAGTVRITASRIVSGHLLPPILAELRRLEPAIEIDLVASDRTENLLFGEADIAVRMYRPTQLDIVTRHVTDLPMALYAAKTYLDRAGRPKSLEDILSRDILGFDRSDLALNLLRGFGIIRRREDFPLRCDDQLVMIELARAGCGLFAMLCRIGDADPALERVIDALQLPPLPVWLAAPEVLRQSPRLRRVFDFLAEALKAPGPP